MPPENRQDGDQTNLADGTPPAAAPAFDPDAFRKELLGDVRKVMAGVVGTIKQGAAPAQAPATPAPPAAAATPAAPQADALTADDVHGMIARRDALHLAIGQTGVTLKGKAFSQMAADFEAAKPEDAGDWAKAWMGEWGYQVSAPNGQTAAQPNTQGDQGMKPPNPNPDSNGGSPAGTAGLESSDPVWGWGQDAVDRLVKEKGRHEAGVILRQRLQRDMDGKRFKIPKPVMK